MEKKMKFDVNYLLMEKLLARIPISKEKAEESIKASHSWLDEAKKNFSNKLFKSSILTSYLGIFHAGRAILFLDGFREKSHFAIARYLESEYTKNGKLEKKWIELLDYCRDLRHQDQYRTSFIVTKEDAKKFIESSENLIKEIEKLFLSKMNG